MCILGHVFFLRFEKLDFSQRENFYFHCTDVGSYCVIIRS